MSGIIEVETAYRGRMLAGAVFGLAILLPTAFFGIKGLVKSGPSSSVVALLAFAGVGLCLCAIPVVLAFERAQTVQRFDVRGVTRFDGTTFLWTDFRELKPMTEFFRSSQKSGQVGWELRFGAGTAILKYRAIANWDEVAPLMPALKSFDPDKLLKALAGHRPHE